MQILNPLCGGGGKLTADYAMNADDERVIDKEKKERKDRKEIADWRWNEKDF
jgi:hypothetical protein